ncbi:helix-loop-helix DNA-binding domain-containing protein, partial [Parasitella parasitica]
PPQQQDYNSNMDNDHTTVGAVPVVRNRLFNPPYHHQRQSSFGTAVSAMSPPNHSGGMAFNENNSQNWFGTSLDSNGSSFGQSPIFGGIVSPSTSSGHLELIGSTQNGDDDDGQQRNLQEMFEKRRRRRESHNAVERRRRDNINERIQELCTLLPEKLLDSAPTSSNVMSVSNGQVGSNGRAINKGTILKLSVDHIKELREDVSNYQEQIKKLEYMIECAKRGELIPDMATPNMPNAVHNTFDAADNTPRNGHQRVGSIQFRQQFHSLQLGP